MIDEFRGDYRFLSNFYLLEAQLICSYKGSTLSFPTTEHFYAAMKSTHLADRIRISNLPTPADAKREGYTLSLREDWDDIKLEVMLYALRWKFSKSNPTLRDKLVTTGNQELREGNTWNDFFWGVDKFTGFGENHLGKLLMKVRAEIRGENYE